MLNRDADVPLLMTAAAAAAGNAPGASAIFRQVKQRIVHTAIDIIDTIQLFRVSHILL
jgi:hypothetical protein